MAAPAPIALDPTHRVDAALRTLLPLSHPEFRYPWAPYRARAIGPAAGLSAASLRAAKKARRAKIRNEASWRRSRK
jgi:hypothetical protein